ncbi:sialate O-acetylesterase [Coraliomargarita algicola]|uniref:Sialate O-acetylesterase n=1 Tax=Coraliomargarita algicola TaxID=3092156 RepID=A0ABZ0RN08_9BACT|nr:sialate O-acetylesterase [Coraliomargarita sp. J2-16]WPJ96609.1 sialate O-acetylesterase [Coraliomargarita sp. J2-16]
MKKIIQILFIALLAVSAANAQKHLFILSGQSNMARLDPAISFTPAVEAALGKDNVIVVKHAQGGLPIRRWYKNWKPAQGDEPKATGDLYDQLMTMVKEATEGQELASITFVWMQGERDAREQYGSVYAASLQGLIEQLSGDLGRDDINVVIGRLSDFDLKGEKYPDWMLVRDAQAAVVKANPRAALVDTDSLNDGLNARGEVIVNDLHYSVEGYETLGTEFANKSIELIEANAPDSARKADAVEDPIVGTHEVLRLWPDDTGDYSAIQPRLDITRRGKIRYENVKDANLVVYLAESHAPTPAVVYSPGGSYKHLTPRPEIIEWLNAQGISVFMLRYTVPGDREAAFKDVQRAMRLVRHNAKRWNVDPDQLGVVGSSAGGHLVARLSQHYATPAYVAVDAADRESCEPQFVVIFSGAYFYKGQGAQQEPVLVEEFPMTADIAPTFLVYAKDDHSFYPGGIAYEQGLKAAGVSTYLIVSETGGHGLKDVNWMPECRVWLEGLGLSLK